MGQPGKRKLSFGNHAGMSLLQWCRTDPLWVEEGKETTGVRSKTGMLEVVLGSERGVYTGGASPLSRKLTGEGTCV
jgi:hypothetical protein